MKQTKLKSYKPLQSKSVLKSNKKPLKSKGKLKSAKPIKVDMWSLSEADRIFSGFIRGRDEVCQGCATAWYLGCSHWEGRETYSTRYDPDNCVLFCSDCHLLFEKDKELYYRFMLHRLGKKKFEQLQKRTEIRINKETSIRNFQEFMITELKDIQF